jgi:hypothetical protein
MLSGLGGFCRESMHLQVQPEMAAQHQHDMDTSPHAPSRVLGRACFFYARDTIRFYQGSFVADVKQKVCASYQELYHDCCE